MVTIYYARVARLVFGGCAMEKLPSSVRKIKHQAFAGCEELKSIEITNKAAIIEENAFEDCNLIVIKCPKDSKAYKYAQKNSIKVEVI
jgi:hypothetical protein